MNLQVQVNPNPVCEPGFCQRLLQNGRQLHDHEVVKGPSELQLVMVPYGVVSAEEEVQMANFLRSRNLQRAEAILGKPYLQSSRLKNTLLCEAAASGFADSVDLLLLAAPCQSLDTPLHRDWSRPRRYCAPAVACSGRQKHRNLWKNSTFKVG